MDGTDILGGVVGIVGVLQVANLYIITGVKRDINSIWTRTNHHGHEAECDTKSCKVKVKNVIITAEGGEG